MVILYLADGPHSLSLQWAPHHYLISMATIHTIYPDSALSWNLVFVRQERCCLSLLLCSTSVTLNVNLYAPQPVLLRIEYTVKPRSVPLSSVWVLRWTNTRTTASHRIGPSLPSLNISTNLFSRFISQPEPVTTKKGRIGLRNSGPSRIKSTCFM